jgi:hypothetical protein
MNRDLRDEDVCTVTVSVLIRVGLELRIKPKRQGEPGVALLQLWVVRYTTGKVEVEKRSGQRHITDSTQRRRVPGVGGTAEPSGPLPIATMSFSQLMRLVA